MQQLKADPHCRCADILASPTPRMMQPVAGMCEVAPMQQLKAASTLPLRRHLGKPNSKNDATCRWHV